MSLQSHTLNPLLYRKERKLSNSAGICEVREVDFVYELWKVLRVKDVSPKYFVPTSLGYYQISNEIRLDAACFRFGRNFIPDLVKNCSECRMKLQAMENFVEYEVHLDQQSLVVMLLKPFKVVLKKFQEESAVDAQKQLTVSQNLEMINCYLIEHKRKVDKTYNFLKEVLQFVATNATEEIPLQLVKTIWKRFLLGLNTAMAPGDEFPLWTDLYVELVNLLGKYFNVVCDRRQLIIKELDFPSNTSDCQKCSSVSSCAKTHHKFQRVSSSQFLPPDHTTEEIKPSYFFGLLMTPRLEADFLQSFRFAAKIETGRQVLMGVRSFQDIFTNQEKLMKLKAEFQSLGNPFKSLVELLEKSAKFYKEQFMDYIFTEINANDQLSIALAEIKELYSMRALAATMSGLLDTFNQPTNMTDCLCQLQRDVISVQNQFCCVKNGEKHENARNQWKIKFYDGEEPWLLKLVVQLEWPLSCVLDDELLELLRRSFETSQRLFYSYNMIANLMQKDSFGSIYISLLVRRKRMLGQNLLESVSVIYSVLRTNFEAIIEQNITLLLQCKSLTEMEQVVIAWKQQFKKLLDIEELNRAVDGLCYLIAKFNDSEGGSVFDQSSNLTAGSSLSVDRCISNSRTGNVKKPESKIEKWIKAQSRVITVLSMAADPSRATDPSSIAYEIAVRSPKNPVTRR